MTARSRVVAALGAVVVVVVARAASAAPCEGGAAAVVGAPLSTLVAEADFGAAPSACGGTFAAFRSATSLLIDHPGFFGEIKTAATVEGALSVGARGTIFGAVDAVDWRYVVNAVIVGDGFSTGPASIGYSHRFDARPQVTWSPYVRALLPLDSARRESALLGLDAGAALTFQGAGRWGARASLSLPTSLLVSAGPPRASFVPGATAEATFRARAWMAFASGARVKTDAAPNPALETAALRASAWFVRASGWFFAITVEVPCAGVEREDLRVALLAGR